MHYEVPILCGGRRMKCKYCKTYMGFLEWLCGMGSCVSCQSKIWTREYNKQSKDSDEYWRNR